MTDEQTFPLGDWSCEATDLLGRKVEVWAVIKAELELDDEGHKIDFRLSNIEIVEDAVNGAFLYKVSKKSELLAFFSKEEIKKIYSSAYYYVAMRFEQTHQPLCFI